MDVTSLLTWHKFNDYRFIEDTHTYYYNNKPVRSSVTQFLHNFYAPFDSDSIAEKYAKKHKLNKEDVLEEWKKKGDISSTAGTIIHAYLENAKRGKTFNIDYSTADKLNIRQEVEERVNILLPQAEEFHQDTLNKLYPIQLEYTVGIQDYIAGNIDMVAWNERAQEFQIWDYKNVKSLDVVPNRWTGYCYHPFDKEYDTNFIHYSMQLNIYKEILERVANIKIGSCFLVQFNYTDPQASFEIYPCKDLQRECKIALDEYIRRADNGY